MLIKSTNLSQIVDDLESEIIPMRSSLSMHTESSDFLSLDHLLKHTHRRNDACVITLHFWDGTKFLILISGGGAKIYFSQGYYKGNESWLKSGNPPFPLLFK